MTILLLANVLLAFAWAAVSGDFSLLNLAFGFVLGALALLVIRERAGTGAYFLHAWRILVLMWTFLYELVLSSFRVASTVLRPNMNVRPAVIAFPLTVRSDAEITLLANMITLTPGTLSLDISDDREVLYIHFIDVDDPEEACRDIASGFERQIIEVFQ